MRYRARHQTRYAYQQAVSQCINEARLLPRSLAGQQVLEARLAIVPEPDVYTTRTDYFGNLVSAFSLFEPHERLTVTASSIVDVQPRTSLVEPAVTWEEARAALESQADADTLGACEFVCDSPFVAASDELARYARPTFTQRRPLVDAVRELMSRIHAEFRYEPSSTEIDTPLAEVLRNRRGVCQDFAHVMIGALRSVGLAARYVSGYLRSGTQYQGAEASHAWMAAFVPGEGWMSFDPTNDIVPGEGHITLAWGRDYGDVTPLKGIALGGGRQTVEVEVHVTPVERDAADAGNGTRLDP
jgi:transglutaminase-like putative cysteine protease